MITMSSNVSVAILNEEADGNISFGPVSAIFALHHSLSAPGFLCLIASSFGFYQFVFLLSLSLAHSLFRVSKQVSQGFLRLLPSFTD